MSQFDIVLWGATGFTGRLVANYLADHPDIDDVDWAIAGRNHDKLRDVRAELGSPFEELPILIGDSFDRPSLDAICEKTDVICSTVGPYARFGTDLVAACVANGTDYCDLTGETHWVRQMIDEYHDEAIRNDVRIVHCCGFDSIPSDLGTLVVQSEAIDRFGTPCDEVRTLVWRVRGGVSGGTAASMAELMEDAAEDSDIRRTMADPYCLNPEGRRSGPDGSMQQSPRYDKRREVWTAPFVMAAINEKVVRRSNALLDNRYGEQFRYSEAVQVGDGFSGATRAAAMSAGLGIFAGAMAIAPTRKLLEKFVLPDAGEGPDEEARQSGHFELRVFGRGTDDSGQDFDIACRVSADLDPGYGATSLMLGNAALSLAIDDVDDGLDGGILTPATALGMSLVERLDDAGMSFEVIH